MNLRRFSGVGESEELGRVKVGKLWVGDEWLLYQGLLELKSMDMRIWIILEPRPQSSHW